jgi:cyclohexyl-isocyanide hydratase
MFYWAGQNHDDLQTILILLARAGLLDGHEATTHWYFTTCLQTFPNITVDTTRQRFVVSRTPSVIG